MDINGIEVNKQYELEVEANAMPEEGVTEILRILQTDGLGYFEWPKYWSWDWQVSKGEYTGTLPKRIGKWLHKHQGKVLNESTSQKIGETAKKFTGSYYGHVKMDFDLSLAWNAGEFGDPKSCFWQSRRDCLRVLKRNKALAVRFYNAEGKGIGRAWCIKHNDGLIIFNGYGLSTHEITRILGEFLNLPYKQIALYFSGSNEHVVFVNGGKAMLLAPTATLRETTSIDLPWTRVLECINCHKEDEISQNGTGRIYCKTCYGVLYFRCKRCDRTRRSVEMAYSNSEPLGVCSTCASYMCAVCKTYEKHIRVRFTGWSICDTCYETQKREAYERVQSRTDAGNLLRADTVV